MTGRWWNGPRLQVTTLTLVVGVLALLRMLPARLVHEEPSLSEAARTLDPITYLLAPNNGQLTILKAAFYLDPFGTRVLAAAIIAAVAAYLWTRTQALPDSRVRLALALSLPLFPLPDPGPYTGPLNGQWWIALAVLGMALSPSRPWHLPALSLAGLSGIAPCLAWPAFRDRRGIVLAAVAAVQVVVLIRSERQPTGIAPDLMYLVIMFALGVSLAFARLPGRTKLAFGYLGLSVLALASLAQGTFENQYRYLAVPAAGIVVGVSSILFGPRDPR